MTDATRSESPAVRRNWGPLALILGILPGLGTGGISGVVAVLAILGVPVGSLDDFSVFGVGVIVLTVLAVLAIVFGIIGVRRSRPRGRLAAAAGIALGAAFLVNSLLTFVPQYVLTAMGLY
jgi:hypothetical protein